MNRRSAIAAVTAVSALWLSSDPYLAAAGTITDPTHDLIPIFMGTQDPSLEVRACQ